MKNGDSTEFHSKRDYLYFSIFAFAQLMPILNPTTVSSLKVLCVLGLVMIFYFTMTTHTVIINKDSIQFSKQLFSLTFSQRSVRVESIEKIERKYITMLRRKDGKSISFEIYSPEFTPALEEFCTLHNISIVDKLSKRH